VRQAAAEAGILFDAELVLQLPSMVNPVSGFEGGLDCARRMLSSGRSFTAVLAFDDLTALGVVRGLTEAGLRVPEDCSVLGFDDVLPAAVATPSITTIRQPLKAMGLLAAEWIQEELEKRDHGRAPEPKLYKAQPELVRRMSSTYAAKMPEKVGEPQKIT
jgi:LacI family transcriptional regulator